jgi:NitT/TauT family transport system substrate-binding protein
VTSEPATLAAAGVKTKIFLLADNGLPGYAAMILAPNSLIAKEPKAIAAFVEATNLGWRDYLHGDPAPGDALIRKDNPEMKAESLAAARQALVDYGIVEGGDALTKGIGVMTEARWLEFFAAMSAVGVYKPDLDWRAAFTTQFLSGS